MNVMRNLRVKKDKVPSVVSGTAGTLGNTLVLAKTRFWSKLCPSFLAVALMGQTCTPVLGLVNQH